MPRFYPNGTETPDVAPEFLVITPTGAWGCDTETECLGTARQLAINGVRVTCVKRAD